MTPAELKAKKEERVKLEQDFIAKYQEYNDEKEEKAWTQDRVDEVKKMKSELEKLDELISTEEAMEQVVIPDELRERYEQLKSDRSVRALDDLKEDDSGSNDLTEEAFYNWVRTGYGPDGRYTEELEANVGQYYSDPEVMAKRALETRALTTASGGGANLVVEDEAFLELQRALYEGDPVRRAGARVITTPTGRPLPLAQIGIGSTAIVETAQGADATDWDPAIGKLTLGAFYHRGHNDFTLEVGQDQGVNFVGIVTEVIRDAVANIRGLRHTSGSGTNQAQGLLTGLTGSALVDSGAATDAEFTVKNIMDLVAAVGERYQDGSSFMMNRDMWHRMLLLDAAEATRGVLGTNSVTMTMLGAPVNLNGHMGSGMAAGNDGDKQIVYGNLRYFIIRDVRGLTFTRDNLTRLEAGMRRINFGVRGDSKIANPTNIAIAALVR